MTIAQPISALTNYTSILAEIDNGHDIVLTKNGRSKYAVVDVDRWEYMVSMLRFLTDMQAVDEEMNRGGARYSTQELLSELAIEA